jgi:hypothetical protein
MKKKKGPPPGLRFDRAMNAMRRGASLVKMSSGFFVVPRGGRVEPEVAARIQAHPWVQGRPDASFPGLEAWRMAGEAAR